MVGIKHLLVITVLLVFSNNLSANILLDSNDFKGKFAESLVDDIWIPAGRKSIYNRTDIHGPDKIYQLQDGTIEIHEVKGYTSWAGKSAMKTTYNGRATYELSQEWLQNWVEKTIKNPFAPLSDKATAEIVSDAMSKNKCKYVLDEINFSTKQFRYSNVIQRGNSEIFIEKTSGLSRIKYFERFYSTTTKNLASKLLVSPRMSEWSTGHPLTREQYNNLARGNFSKDTIVVPGLLTQEGRLLVALNSGTKSGLMVFAADAGVATYSYVKGDIDKNELNEELWNAVIKGTIVGNCTAVAVFLTANPSGIIITAVGIGSYFIAEKTVCIWRENQKRKYLTFDDLSSWGIKMDSLLEIPSDSLLDIPKDTTLNLPTDSLLDIKPNTLL